MFYEKVAQGETEKIKMLSDMATRILKEHYDPIVGEEQNKYMLNKFQSVKAITEQINEGYQYFFVVDDDGNKVGFMAFYPVGDRLYISKFYLEKTARGKGYAKDMLRFVIDNAKAQGLKSVYLNVNRFNSSVYIYEKLGFVRVGEEKRDIGYGYYMDDYVYEYYLGEAK